MRKLISMVLALLTVVLLSTPVLASGGVFGPFWFNCETVADWDSFDYSTCSSADREASVYTNMVRDEVKAIGLSPSYSHNPVDITMSWAEFGSSSWTVFYHEYVNTYLDPSHIAPFVAETISFDDLGTYKIKVELTPAGQPTVGPFYLFATVSNQAPVLRSISDKTVNEGSLLRFFVSASDPDGDSVTISASNLPDGARFTSNRWLHQFSWIPDYDQEGDYYVTFTATDAYGAADSQDVLITVVNTNRCPEIANILGATNVAEGEVVSLTVQASDPDGDSVVYSAEPLPDGASIGASSGRFAWSTGSDQSGVYDITFTASDYECSDEQDLRITVDDSPLVVALDADPISGDEPLDVDFVCAVSGGDDPVSYEIDFGDGSEASQSTASHTYDNNGVYTATCTVVDADGDIASDSVEITVNNLVPDVELTITHGDSGVAPFTTGFSCDVENGNEPYIVTMDFGDGRVFSFSGDHLSLDHTFTEGGTYTVICSAVDADGDYGSDSEIVTVTENSCPVLRDIEDHSLMVGNTLEIHVSAYDADGDTLTYSADEPFSDFIHPTMGVFSWTPVEEQIGTHVVTVRVTDGVCEDSLTFEIDVTESSENHAPNADFVWSPEYPVVCEADVCEETSFTSTSTDPDGDSLTCEWYFDDDLFVDSEECETTWLFEESGDHPVTLTVSDGELSDSETKTVSVVGALDVSGLSCLDPVIENSFASCTVSVRSDGAIVGGANSVLYYEDGSEITNCVTDSLTGDCVFTFPAGEPGVYTVYATAEKSGWIPDLDSNPTATFNVLSEGYTISDLAVYNDPLFLHEDYDFFRGEDMYVSFTVLDPSGNPVDDVVTSVILKSPPGGEAEFSEFDYPTVAVGDYYYSLDIPATHSFLGNSQVFTFAFNFADGSGAEMVVQVIIRNNPPVIDPVVVSEFSSSFSEEAVISLTPYESDVEDSGAGLAWNVMGVDSLIASVSVDADDSLAITPVSTGRDVITLVLSDLDGGTDTIDIQLNTVVGQPTPECSDGVDNDGDGLVDLADPGCTDQFDDSEADGQELPECSDGIDNDGDGLVDLADPDCSDSDDDSEHTVVFPQCSDGIDNDGDGKIDLADPHCHDAADDYEGELFVDTSHYVFRDQDDLLITRIDLDGFDVESSAVYAGDYFRLGVGLENTLDYDLKDIKVEASIYELDVRSSDILRDLESDDSANVVFNLEVPYHAEPGVYDLRVVVSNNDIRRVKYRTIAIV